MNLGHPVKLVHLEDDRLDKALNGCEPARQIVLNWCEEIPGIPHSSAMVAQALESLGFTFTGAGSKALSFAQDKPAVKTCLSRKKIPTPAWQVYRLGQALDWGIFPAIVKPAYEHSSFGISHEAVVHDRHELTRPVDRLAMEFKQPVLVEDFIGGREFHVSIVGNGTLQVLPIAEMDFSAIQEGCGRLCTYDSKFVPASADYQMIQLRLPAVLSAQETVSLEGISLAAYRATGCRDYARLDIRLRAGEFHVLDVNPNADISPDTSLVLAAEQAGLGYGQFGSLLIELAGERHPHLPRSEKSICVASPKRFSLFAQKGLVNDHGTGS
jgi:D-alanine-D-alanine ligase